MHDIVHYLSSGASDVFVPLQMVGAVTGRSSAFGTVTEVHIRMTYVRNTANNTAMKWLFFRFRISKLAGLRCHMSPARSDSVLDIRPEEQQEIADRGKDQQLYVPCTGNQDVAV